MKILQLVYESLGNPFGFGGAGVRAYEIYRRLKDEHEITLLCMRYPGAGNGLIEGLNHIFVGSETGNLTASVLAYTIKATRFVKRYGGEYDVIVENFLPSTPFFSPLLTQTPVILQVQGIMEGHSLRKFSPLYSLPMYVVERFYPRFFDRFIFASEITRDKVLRKRGSRGGGARLCTVISNGVNGELLDTEPVDGDYILFFSRIDGYTKGLDILMSSFEKLSAEFPDIMLVLAGHETDNFAKLTANLQPIVKNRVHYAGFLSGEKKRALLSGAKMVVLPSRHESFPVSVLEAAACSKPLVVSDIPEMRFVDENGFGLAFPSGSAEGLKEKMGFLLKDKGLRTALGRKGREYARDFLWDSVAKEFENALQSVIDEKQHEKKCSSSGPKGTARE